MNYKLININRFKTAIVVILASAILYGFSFDDRQKDHITNPIVDQVSSDLQGITISITFDTNYAHTFYSIPFSQDTNKTANTNKLATDKALIHFPCTGGTADKFVIPQNRVSAVIKTKYNLGIYDGTDFVFTEDSLYIINTTKSDGNLYSSNIYVLPSLDSKYEYQTFLSGNNTGCGLNKPFFYKVLDFCSKHDIKY